MKASYRWTECPCYRAKSLELLNSRLHFYFRIDKERWMLIQIFFLFLFFLSLDKRTQSKRKENFSLFSLLFSSLLHPNRGHFVIVQTFIHLIYISYFRLSPKETSKLSIFTMEVKLSKVLLMIILLYLFQIDICSIMGNDPSDFRFVSYNGMYMWESTPFVFSFSILF